MRFFIGLKKRKFGENGIFHEEFKLSMDCRLMQGYRLNPLLILLVSRSCDESYNISEG